MPPTRTAITEASTSHGRYHRAVDIPTKRALLYVRVSTNKQAQTDLDPDGLSLPFQMDACQRKSVELGAYVVETYSDKGESAKTANRPQFMAMVERVKRDRDIDYVIVDRLNRFARNMRDAGNIMHDLEAAGARLISVKENLDDTPTGRFQRTIILGQAEYESGNIGVEALKGMTQKARVGGTPFTAPIGYRNYRRHDEGSSPRGIALIEVDPERAPFIQWAFETYATGEWSIPKLTEALEARGLRSVSRGKPSRPIGKGAIHRILSNPYYMGIIEFRGERFEGRHEAIVTAELFYEVQSVLAARAKSGERERRFHHFLKGSVYCGVCGSRMVFTRTSGNGGSYDYFRCFGSTYGNDCTVRYIRADAVEEQIEDIWRRLTIDAEVAATARDELVRLIGAAHKETRTDVTRAERQIKAIADKRAALLDAYTERAVPLDLYKQKEAQLAHEQAEAQRLIQTTASSVEDVTVTLDGAFRVLERGASLYLEGSPSVRRRLNQALFDRFEVYRDETVGNLAEPFKSIGEARTPRPRHRRDGSAVPRPGSLSSSISHPFFVGDGWSKRSMVPPAGLEPATFGLEVRRSIRTELRRHEGSSVGGVVIGPGRA